MQNVATNTTSGALGPVWKCDLCGWECAFLSVMIAHLFTTHAVRSLRQADDYVHLEGIVDPEQ